MNIKNINAYDLLTDMRKLEINGILSPEDCYYLNNAQLSHKYENFVIGKIYLKYFYDKMIESAFSKFEGKSFLEIGCGTGTQCILAAIRGFDNVCGIDLIDKRVEIALKRSRYYGVENNVNFYTGDFWKIIENRKFDSFYSMFAFELFGHPAWDAVDKLVSMLNPSSTVIIDMGRVREYSRLSYFDNLKKRFEEHGYRTTLYPMIPFIPFDYASKLTSPRILYSFRALRLFAKR